MTTLVGVLMLAAPMVTLAALVLAMDRRHARRHAEILRQIALTDALHATLGAVVAPVVRSARGGWQVTAAVAVERPDVVTVVLATVDEMFAGSRYEVVLSRPPAATPRARAARSATLGRESLSWT